MKNLLKEHNAGYAVLITIFLSLLLPQAAGALDQYPGDTVIYGVSTDTIAPNVLVIFDNSGSMNSDVSTGLPYDHDTTYAQVQSCNGSFCATDSVYRWRSRGKRWELYISDVNTISCNKAKDKLTDKGMYTGKLRKSGSCKGKKRSFATGNYINWLALGGGSRTKLAIAKEVLTNLVSTSYGVNFGMMLFNTSDGGHIAGVGDSFGYSGYDAYIKDMDAIFSGTETNRTALINTIDNISANTWTPLAETLYEAMRYYKGESTYFNGSYTYTSPIEFSCQQNYVILITDGESTQDMSTVLTTICNSGDCDGDNNEPANDGTKTYTSSGSDYLDDVAKYLYDNDLLPDTSGDPKTEGPQRVITYTIGFGLAGKPSAERLLQETATNGGGEYYSAESTAGLSESLRQIIASIVEENTSFVAPVLPISPENRTFTGDRVYIGFFKPAQQAFWSGNLKKFGIDENGEILDSNDNLATNADGSIIDSASSYWNASLDGGTVEAGGVGEKLLDRTSARDIYTYTGTTKSLTDPTNRFITTNTAITATLLSVATDTDKDRLIEYVHGNDPYDSDSDGNTTEKRDWILGDVLHSRPHTINYSSFGAAGENDCNTNKNIIYLGSNDGMLHAFRDCDGSEAWAFIPPDLLTNLSYMNGATHTYFVDGSPASYVYDANRDGNIDTGDKAVLLFGERRGGGYYYALDVTSPTAPSLLWWISATEVNGTPSTAYSELAETWSKPSIGKVRLSSGDKVLAFFGAGYDNDAEDTEPPTAATKGKGIYATLIATLGTDGSPTLSTAGTKIWSFTNGITDSFPAKLSLIDSQGGGFTDRAYGGDTGGNLWRLDIGGISTADWSGRKLFKTSGGQKFFYNPSVTQEFTYDMVFLGTGDRAHPTATGSADRLYGIKDAGQTTTLTEANLSNATVSEVNITSTQGWYLALPNSDEKSLAKPSVLSKVAYFTTYVPPTVSGLTCSEAARGTSMLYALKYLTAGAAANYNTSNDDPGGSGDVIDTSDRSKSIGRGIPSSLAIRISGSGLSGSRASAIIGVGGALVTETLEGTVLSIPTYWREVH